MASAPPEIIEAFKNLMIMTLAADPTVPVLVAHPNAPLGYTGLYKDQIPPGGPGGQPSLISLYPALVVKDMSGQVWYVAGNNGLAPIGFEVVANISACSYSRSATELVPIINAANAALFALNGQTLSGFRVRSMILENPLTDARDDPSGAPRRWLGGLWRAKGDL